MLYKSGEGFSDKVGYLGTYGHTIALNIFSGTSTDANALKIIAGIFYQ